MNNQIKIRFHIPTSKRAKYRTKGENTTLRTTNPLISLLKKLFVLILILIGTLLLAIRLNPEISNKLTFIFTPKFTIYIDASREAQTLLKSFITQNITTFKEPYYYVNNKYILRFTDSPKSADLTIALSKTTKNPADKLLTNAFKQQYYYILVPVTSLDNPKDNITPESTNFILKSSNLWDDIVTTLYKLNTYKDPSTTGKKNDLTVKLIPFEKLSYKEKLLSIKNKYLLDELYARGKSKESESKPIYGAFGLRITFSYPKGNQKQETARYIIQVLSEDLTNTLPRVSKITVTGVTAITRGLMRKLETLENPTTIIDNFLKRLIKNSDIIHTSNEVSFKPGCNSYKGMRFCSKPEHFVILRDLGINLVELTGNHNNDSGFKWNIYSLDLYKKHNIAHLGGGYNLEDAQKPYITTLPNGTKVAFLGYNYFDTMLNNQTALAGSTHPGANPFNLEKIKSDINNLKNQGIDNIFVHIQFQECYAYPKQRGIRYTPCYKPLPKQQEIFRKIADLGAKFVVGTQAHQPQQIKLYKDSVILYGLGNFLFDQIFWIGTREGIIPQIYFINGKPVQVRIIPTLQNLDYTIRMMTEKEREEFYKWIFPKSKTTD